MPAPISGTVTGLWSEELVMKSVPEKDWMAFGRNVAVNELLWP